ncbi:MAG: RidA family protein [Burkholderiales bacterium]|nr:RidA family protein [Burkholderiales bacterium]
MKVLQPGHWARPRGYVNGIAARGTLVALAGQVGWLSDHSWPSDDVGDQVLQALKNIRELLAEAGGTPQHIVRLNLYVRDRADYFAHGKQVGTAFREILGDHRPPVTAVEVQNLMVDEAKVEIEALAVIPDRTQ